MSQAGTLGDLDKARSQWMRAFAPMALRELVSLELAWERGLGRVPYLRVVKSQRGGLFTMLEFRCALKFEGLNPEMARGDILRIWQTDVVTEGVAHHAFRDTPTGFEFTFAALLRGTTYVTGSVTIVRKELT